MLFRVRVSRVGFGVRTCCRTRVLVRVLRTLMVVTLSVMVLC